MVYKKIIIIILLVYKKCNGLQLFIRENFLSLKNIVSSRAVISTVTNQINNEFLNDNILVNEIISPTHNYKLDLFYSIIFILSIYAQFKYFTYLDDKWKGVKSYSTIQEKTSIILFIFMMVFTKNIQNAI
jgi:hypothetical protein